MYIALFIFGMNEILLQTVEASHFLVSVVSNNVTGGWGCDLADNVRSSKGILLMS
jgi:hypothetical protein